MMRGLISWMRSQVKPCRSSTPGPKFSTMTSHCRIRSSRIVLPPGDFRLIVMLRLFRSEALPGEALPIEHAGAEILDHDVALPDQVLEDRFAARRFQVDCDAALVQIGSAPR